jgi:hypothetical protein
MADVFESSKNVIPTLIVRFLHNLNIISPLGRTIVKWLLFNELKVQSAVNICDIIALNV